MPDETPPEQTTRETHGRPAMGSGRSAAWLALILIGAAALRLALDTGFRASDDWFHVLVATQLREGTFDPSAIHFIYRLGLSAPIAALQGIFGTAPAVQVAWPFVGSLLHVVAAWTAGRVLFGERVALGAALLLAVAPLEIELATFVEPDVLSAAFAAFAVSGLVAAGRTAGRRAVLTGLAGGLALGAAYLCKESVVFLFPTLAGIGLWRAVRARRLEAHAVAFGAAALGVAVGEMALFRAWTGDALHRLHLVQSVHEASPLWSWQHYVREHPNHPVLRRLLVDLPAALASPRYLGVLIVGALATLAVRARTLVAAARDEGAGRSSDRLAAWWLLSLLAVFAFGSTNLGEYRPLYVVPRYFVMLSVPAAVVFARGLERLALRGAERAARRAPRVAAALAIACGAAAIVLLTPLGDRLVVGAAELAHEAGRLARGVEFHRPRLERATAAAGLGALAAAIVAAVGAAALRRPRRSGRVAAAVILAGVTIGSAALAGATLQHHGTRWRAVAERLEREGLAERPVATDERTRRGIAWWRDFDASGVVEWPAQPPASAARFLFVVDERWSGKPDAPAWLDELPTRELLIVAEPGHPRVRVLETSEEAPPESPERPGGPAPSNPAER